MNIETAEWHTHPSRTYWVILCTENLSELNWLFRCVAAVYSEHYTFSIRYTGCFRNINLWSSRYAMNFIRVHTLPLNFFLSICALASGRYTISLTKLAKFYAN